MVNYVIIWLVFLEKVLIDVIDFVCGYGKILFFILVVGNEVFLNDLLVIMESCWKYSMIDEYFLVDCIFCVGGKLLCY